MAAILTYRGLSITDSKLKRIRTIIQENPHDSRCALSRRICKIFNWVQANGYLRDMVCRSLMIHLERGEHITLPAPHPIPPQFRKTKSIGQLELNLEFENKVEISDNLRKLLPVRIEQVRRTKAEKLYIHLIRHYHYLGYVQPVGEHLKYMVYSAERPIGCISFGSAPRHIGCRDRFIGWDQQRRKRNMHLIATNTRFLILPWVHVPYLASHILGKIVRRISGDWEKFYNHSLYFLETFVDTERFSGTCYKAANWIHLGLTTGRGKNDQTHKVNRSIKAVWGYPLDSKFREKLCAQ